MNSVQLLSISVFGLGGRRLHDALVLRMPRKWSALQAALGVLRYSRITGGKPRYHSNIYDDNGLGARQGLQYPSRRETADGFCLPSPMSRLQNKSRGIEIRAHVGRLEISYSSVDLITRSTNRQHQSYGKPLAAYKSIHQLKRYVSLCSRRTWRRGEPDSEHQ